MSGTIISELEWRRLNHLAKVKVSMAAHAAWRGLNAPEPSVSDSCLDPALTDGQSPHSGAAAIGLWHPLRRPRTDGQRI